MPETQHKDRKKAEKYFELSFIFSWPPTGKTQPKARKQDSE